MSTSSTATGLLAASSLQAGSSSSSALNLNHAPLPTSSLVTFQPGMFSIHLLHFNPFKDYHDIITFPPQKMHNCFRNNKTN